ncbi:LuxR family transcriptional regulator [Actinotalea sp. K2]|uniref:AAA family ATPase n=1 Tax=Actinotalea sp. K2 TaxID=2939438 RepID=UPI002016D288|nr:LuxR family transcriptional regulator [Actinotalea sp. K2]MCL3862125.1 LuxR family transcriptional regulator [Actinotalea sp. K2]
MGRSREREAVDTLLSSARSGLSGPLVVRGEAGIGKTAVLEHARHMAETAGFRVESSVGFESETQFAFAGLHQLCAPLLDRITALPESHQAALGVAFGLHGGAAPDRFLVGLATLNLMAAAAEERALLCLVDDAQWLDEESTQVLAFVARRLGAERLALIFGLRDSDGGERPPFTGLPEIRLERLGDADARALLDAAVRTPLDEAVRERVLAEAAGNALALQELPHHVGADDAAGGFELPGTLSVPLRLEEGFRHRAGGLPPQTQLLLLVAAVEPTGDVALLWRVASHLGLAREVAVPAEAAGLLQIGARVRFRHPLVRSAVYRAAAPPDRRRAHGALAEATDPRADPDRRAWHHAQAVLGADEEAAAGLERSAGRARARGGVAAAGAFLQQAAELSPDPAARARRALEAAHAKHEAGATEAALQLLAVAANGPLDPLPRARAGLLRAQIAFRRSRAGDGPKMLLDAAEALAPLDGALARETYLQALDAAIITGDPDWGVKQVAAAARAAPAPPRSPQPADLLLDALVTTFTRGYEAGVPGLRRALIAFGREQPHPGSVPDADSHRWMWLASRTALAVFDDELAHTLADRHVRVAREAGALGTLPAALLVQSIMHVLAGELARAAELAAEQTSITAATTAVPLLQAQLVLAAWRGRAQETSEIYAVIVRDSAARGHDTEVVLAQYALSVLHNGTGEYPAARAAASRAFGSAELTYTNLAHSELIESAARTGEPERAADALDELCSRARASGTPWALGIAARSQALATTGPEAESHYREAIDQLSDSRMGGYLARTHLVYGEWLRREGRRKDARDQLRTAHRLLSDMGADAFAARAAGELHATGEHPRSRTAQPTNELTAQELQVARLVATGSSSRQVGVQLFLSPRTIEAHLRTIYRKLGITSRRELDELFVP